MIDQRTPNLNLPLPHASNDLSEDVERVRSAISGIDAAIATKPSLAEVQAEINSLIDAAPGALDTLAELSAALGDDPNFAATIAGQIAAVEAGAMPVDRKASATVLGGVKVGANLVIDAEGVLSAPGAGGGGTQSFEVLDLIPTAGQTVFNITGGYVPGQIEVLLNGVELMSDDYTATNGTTVVLAAGASVTDVLRVRKWSVFDVALVATQAEAEAGVINAKVMTPLRVKQAITALSPATLPIRTPTNASPASGATNVAETPTLTGSQYLSLYSIAQNGAQFQISTSSDFGTVHHDSGTLGAVTSYLVPGGVHSVNTNYWFRLRYRDAENVWSEWSSPTQYATAATFNSYIATPAATPSNFGDALEGGFYAGMVWNQIAQSSSSKTLATGTQTFAVPDMTGAPIVYAGQTLEVRSRANPANKFIGTVTGATGTTLTLNVSSVGGSGTFSDWSVMARFRVIVAPKSSGEHAGIALKNATTALPSGCQSLVDGWTATEAMKNADTSTVYPAAHWARGLNIGGRTDWYIPARDELELCWRNLKPATNNNYVTADRPTGQSFDYKINGAYGDTANTHGLNNNSSPTGAAYTASVPWQTAATAFRTGGAEAYEFGSAYYWSSTECSAAVAWAQLWNSSNPGHQNNSNKTVTPRVRAVRRSII